MTRISFAAPVVLLITLCLGCTFNYPADTKSADSTAVAAPVGNLNEQPKKNAVGPKQSPSPAPDPDWDKKIVKTADLRLEVKSFDKFTKRLHEAVKQAGGYISQEEQVQSPTEISNSVTIKVPVLNFDDLLMQLPSDSDRLIAKKIGSQDVTMEMVDTKSRLETKKEVRERYIELLRQAHTTSDILTMQNEINGVQQEMDQASGRIAWLGHSAAFSTINLNFYQLLAAPVPKEAPPSFFTRLLDSIGEGWGGLSEALLGVVKVWPLLLAFGLVVYGIRKYMNGVKAKAAVAARQEEAAK